MEKEKILKKIEDYIEKKENAKDNILEILLVSQELNKGMIDKKIQKLIANKLKFDLEEIEDTVKFFPFLRESREKVKVEVCMGTSCYMGGNSIVERILRREATENIEVVEKECSESCDYGPRVCVKHKIFQYVVEEDVEEIIGFAEKEWKK